MKGGSCPHSPDAVYHRGMKGYSYFLCPECGSVTVSSSPVSVACCGSPRQPLVIEEGGSDAFSIRTDGDELVISICHPMTKDFYIPFIALEGWNGVIVRKLYPEWDADVIIPRQKGRLVWAFSSGRAFSEKV